MPKNTKDLIKEEQINNETVAKPKKAKTESTNNKKEVSTKKALIKKSSSSKNSSTEENTKTVTKTKKSTSKGNTQPKTKKVTKKESTTAKKNSTVKKGTSTKAKTPSKKGTSNKKTNSTAKRKTSKTTIRSKKANSKNTKTTNKIDIIEYYDLPYRYNQTVVKILAQTPTTLFVYWDISDSDRESYIKQYGEHFFENTIPVLIVHNKTMNYSFEIEINDFANSWYFNVNDAKCEYEIELGRRAKPATITIPNNYMYVASSNVIEAPNNHILFEKNQKTLFFRNVKTNNTFSKDVSHFEFIKYIGRIYNIYDVYKKIYKDEELQDLEHNPTSKF